MESSSSVSPVINTPSSQHSSLPSPSSSLPSTRAQRRGSRTTNACEACKKRKTKCSGPSGPCDACQKVNTFCYFNARLDTRRKLAYKPAALQERQQYILQGLLQILKFGEDDEILKLINLIRGDALPQDIAACLRKSIQLLQDRGILQSLAVDETDIMSLGLQGLFSHRAGKPGLKQSPKKLASSIKNSLISQELCSRPEALGGKDLSTRPSSCFHGVKFERNDSLFSSLHETNMPNSLGTSDSVPLPCENTNHLLSVSSYTTEESYPHNLDTTYSEAQPRHTASYHSHNLHEPGNHRQWSSGNVPTVSIAPQFTFKDHAGNNGHATYRQFELASPGSDMTRTFSADIQAMMNANAYTSRQLNDRKRMEYELSSRHRISNTEWNIPHWTYEANTIQDGY